MLNLRDKFLSRTTPTWPYHSPDEIAEMMIKTVIPNKTSYRTGGEGHLFEKEFAAFCGSKHGYVVTSGSLALELALDALKIGFNDEVIVTPRTFITSVSSIVLCGATPVFADVDPISQNITADTIAKVISPRTKAILVVHLAGWPCDMDPINELAKANGLKVIEDCAQAHGATYKGRMVGSLGDVSAFSFGGDSIIGTLGEGGMVLFNDDELWKWVLAYKDHEPIGKKSYKADHPRGSRWIDILYGKNFHLLEAQAATGRIQLQKLPAWLERRRKNATILTESFKTIPALRVTEPPESIEHSYYRYDVFVRPEKLKPGWSREKIVDKIEKQGVSCPYDTCPEVYLEQAFQDDGMFPEERLPVAKELGETSMQFLVHPTLGDEDMHKICRAVKKVFAKASL